MKIPFKNQLFGLNNNFLRYISRVQNINERMYIPFIEIKLIKEKYKYLIYKVKGMIVRTVS